MANWTVFLDTDGDGQVDATELSRTTATDGSYQFLGLTSPNTYTVTELLPPGWTLTCPLPNRTYTISLPAVPIPSANFGNRATPFIVSTLSDLVDGNYSDGPLSLREALLLASQRPGDDVIQFNLRLPATISLSQGQLSVDSNVDIKGPQGPGANQLTIDGGRNARVFRVAVGVIALIDRVIIANGSANNSGGGIENEGTLTLSQVAISDCHATGSGGGVHNVGTLTVIDSTIGSNNGADADGGGIWSSGTLRMANSTISGNGAHGSGGGLYVLAGDSVLTNVTIAENQGSAGGGVFNKGGTVTLGNTIVAQNMLPSGNSVPGIDVGGLFADASSYNLIGVIDGSSNLDKATTRFGSAAYPLDPLLSKLGDQGGPTWTRALRFGSLAIDAGQNSLAEGAGLDHDQRGFDRRVDAYGSGTPTVDIGATEFRATTTATISGTISFRDRLDKLLANKAVIPRKVHVTIFGDESGQYQWPPGPAIYTGVVSPRNTDTRDEWDYKITTGGLSPDGTYTIAYSVFGTGLKPQRLSIEADGTAHDVDVRLTYENVARSGYRVSGRVAYEIVDVFNYVFKPDEITALKNAMAGWAATGLVDFYESHFAISNFVTFQRELPSIVFKNRPAGTRSTGTGAAVHFAWDWPWTDSRRLVRPAGRNDWFPEIGATPLLIESYALHEIGHALGLSYEPMGDEGPYPDTSEDGQWSIMSYKSCGKTLWLGWSDVQSLRQLNSTSLTVTSYSPVDLMLSDAAGNSISKAHSNIPDGSYAEVDLDADGDLDDQITIPDPSTQAYSITVIPEPDADPDAPVTLVVEDHGVRRILLDNVRVADLPTSPIVINVDRTAPVVTVDPRTTTDRSPALNGTVDDPQAEVWVSVADGAYQAVNNGDGTWTLAAGQITPALTPGTYDVAVGAADATGNQGWDTTPGELRVTNSPPVLDPSGNMSLTSISMNETDNPGTLVSDIIASAGGDRITDPDPGAVEGIAIVAADRTKGDWQYSTDNGAVWHDVGSPSGGAALLLASDANTRVRFQPSPDFVGTVARGITFYAWDQTTGGNGETVDIWNSGDGIAFSTLIEMASITVLSGNHAPTDILLDNTVVKENLPGIVIGTLTVVDEDAGDTFLIFASDPPRQRFLVTMDGKLKLKDDQSLDEMLDAGLRVEVTATDSAGLIVTRQFAITVIKNDFPWHNAAMPCDVDGNGRVQPLDVLIVINEINARGSRPLPVPPPVLPVFWLDAAPNNFIEAADALAVINYINSHPLASGEAEPAPAVLLAAAAAVACPAPGLRTDQVRDETLRWQPGLGPHPPQPGSDPLLQLALSERPGRTAGPDTTAKFELAWEDLGLSTLAFDDALADIAEDVSAAARFPKSSPLAGELVRLAWPRTTPKAVPRSDPRRLSARVPG